MRRYTGGGGWLILSLTVRRFGHESLLKGYDVMKMCKCASAALERERVRMWRE